jgi:hypothetical protein
MYVYRADREQKYLESDADDQMYALGNPAWVVSDDDWRILRVPFTGSVKLRALLLKAGPGDKTPAKVSLVGKPIDYGGRK